MSVKNVGMDNINYIGQKNNNNSSSFLQSRELKNSNCLN